MEDVPIRVIREIRGFNFVFFAPFVVQFFLFDGFGPLALSSAATNLAPVHFPEILSCGPLTRI
jgi:hypothetical protein